MGHKQLSTEERYSIAALRQAGYTADEIAVRLSRHRSTIFREVARNKTAYDGAYRPSQAVERTHARRTKSRRNLQFGAAAFKPVEDQLRQQLSPSQIVGRSRRNGLFMMSHDTIYKWIWRDMESGGTLWRHLRGARKQRRKRNGRKDSRGRLAGKKMIGERPPEANDRMRLGDWEIDTIHGCDKAAVLTLVDRKSRFVLMGKLPRATADLTHACAVRLLLRHRHALASITGDNGSEFHSYKLIEEALGIPFYFATPHHAWERGTNENTNGLIRQYLPKGSSLKDISQKDCDCIANKLNNRPRKVLGYLTPSEVFLGKDSVAIQS